MTNPYSAQDYGAFILRLAFAAVLISHALLKIFVFTVPGTVGFFESLGLPGLLAYLTILGELGGGAAIMLGLYTRIVSLLTLPIMIGATWVHLANGWVFSAKGGGWEYPALLAVLAIVVALQGAGAFALKKVPALDPYIPAALKA